MTLQQLLHRQDQNFVYKPVDETTVVLTEEEKENVLRKLIFDKIAKIKSAAYLKAVSTEPKWIIPTFDELYQSAISELKIVYGWEIDRFNEPVIKTLCYYFSNDESFE